MAEWGQVPREGRCLGQAPPKAGPETRPSGQAAEGSVSPGRRRRSQREDVSLSGTLLSRDPTAI